jgi:nickel/cobalt transporter (NiCoT) family protein
MNRRTPPQARVIQNVAGLYLGSKDFRAVLLYNRAWMIFSRNDLTDQTATGRASRMGPLKVMSGILLRSFGDGAHLKNRIVGIAVLLLAANAAAWAWALIAFHDHPVLLGTAFLAYSLGLRHAVDADHIAAIDNVTRKLMQEGKRSLASGFFFSLGHSTVVVFASIGVAATATAFKDQLDEIHIIGGTIGTLVSAAFLLLIAAINVVILVNVYRGFQRVKAGGGYHADDLDLLLAGGGCFTRIFRRLFGLIARSWHMYPLGFLFGLGFNTATEVGLLGISAAEAANGASMWSILVFPALFTAGMALIDTADSMLMVGAYGWAFVKPVRKLYYNMTITFVSVLVAIVIGSVEALGLLLEKLGLSGGVWDLIAALNNENSMMGYVIVAIFGGSWAVSIAIYRLKGYDAIEMPALPGGSG